MDEKSLQVANIIPLGQLEKHVHLLKGHPVCPFASISGVLERGRQLVGVQEVEEVAEGLRVCVANLHLAPSFWGGQSLGE
jgi:hypothetical protein